MMERQKNKLLIAALVAAVFLMPIQLQFCQAAEVTGKNVSDAMGAQSVKGAESPQEIAAEEDDESGLSTPMMIGIGVGAAVLIGGAVALGSSGGGGDDAITPAPVTPPTSDELVSVWNAEGYQPGSGLTYSGTYSLYQGGSLAYDLNLSDGRHFVGGGNWSLNGYTLKMNTDHGSRYVGDFEPGNITTVSLNATTGWTLTLSR